MTLSGNFQNKYRDFRSWLFVLVLLWWLPLMPAAAQEVKVEAESGQFTGVSVFKSVAGYSGTGVVGRFTSTSDKLTLSVPLTVDARYDIFIGYCVEGTTKIINVDVNGTRSSLEIPILDGKIHEVKFGNLALKAGNVTVTITPNWTWFYIDYVRFTKSEAAGTGFSISPIPVNSSANLAAQNVYSFLKDNFLQKTISGVMTLKPLSNSTNEISYLKGITGREPALLGLDFMDHINSSWVNNPDLIKDAKTWWGRRGIVALCWHWRDPSRTTSAFYTADTSFDITAVNDTTSAGYKAMVRDMDQVAGYLKELQAAGVAVLWRPLHEAAGGWFWWGAKGAGPCVNLWRLMFNRFTYYHRLNNLIWIWTTTDDSKALAWYPGDDYVDILGMDIYPGEKQHGSQVISFEKVKEIFGGHKIITLSECGSIPYPEQMQSDGAYWSYFMPWYGTHTKDSVHNSVNDWKKILGSDFVITLDEMPQLAVSAINKEVSSSGPFDGASLSWSREGIRLELPESAESCQVCVYDTSGHLLFRKDKLRENPVLIPVPRRKRSLLLVQVSNGQHRRLFKLAP